MYMNQSTKSILLWGGVALGIVALVYLLAVYGNTSTSTATTLITAVSEDDQTKGSETPRITLVEYSDFQCPACASTYPIVKQVADAYPNDVQFVYRHYPLTTIHQNAQLSAQASEAAALQGKFWDMHDVLFNTQAQWSNLDNPTDFFATLATSIGIDEAQFRSDLTSSAVKQRVSKNESEANAMRLPGTPSFFFNGSLIDHPGSYAGFKSLIDAELAK